MFKLINLSFKVDNKVILKPLSMEFKAGRFYGLIGHNGSGKSTLIKLLAKQELPSSGAVHLSGKDLQTFKAKEFAQTVAYLPQHLPQQTFLKAKELVEMGRFAWQGIFKKSNQEDLEIIEECLKLTDTQMFANSLIDNLSGGERVRVWLGMLLAQKTQFILLDEPLAPLDIAHQVEIMKLLKSLSDNLGLGVIIVIHDINLASRFCDQIIALHSGEVIYDGDSLGLMQQSRLREIYDIDLNIIDHPQAKDVKVSFY
ncbi:iron-hydroxamate transporter ATP-binding subunit [Psittacicella hinzii]|uniref:Iron-hydroxamate transporter ATP-binding subunit n=1 Tax=Psittacicella hinzii TaxID=2028575 RepID=A0A3A1XYN5_9GAMM|nr:ABC transporter ATP-binding protein [Psittacicella hinzii]RIY31083.1 iron-hydroxamate transporter ATP-binding subunit [Psittacicella hinzii]